MIRKVIEVYCDNLLEGYDVFKKIQAYNDKSKIIKSVGLTGSPTVPIFSFFWTKFHLDIIIKGYYEDLPEKVKNYIRELDKPDIVIYCKNDDEIILAGEFTETVSVGNSQFQRSGRTIAALFHKIPFVAFYPSVAEDRSADQLREPTSLLPLLFLILGKTYKVKAFLIFKNDGYLASLEKNRDANKLKPLERINGEEYLVKLIFFTMLTYIDNKFRASLEKIELIIVNAMLKYLDEEQLKYKKKIKRIENDLSINSEDIEEVKKNGFLSISKTDWVGIKGKLATCSFFQEFIGKMISLDINFYSYAKRGKFSVTDETTEFEEQLKRYYKSNSTNQLLDSNLPTLIIPIQGWKSEGTGISDPNCGEVTAFPSLFCYKLNDGYKKPLNVVYFIYGKAPSNWEDLYETGNSKLFRGIKAFGDLLCLDRSKNDNPVCKII